MNTSVTSDITTVVATTQAEKQGQEGQQLWEVTTISRVLVSLGHKKLFLQLYALIDEKQKK